MPLHGPHFLVLGFAVSLIVTTMQTGHRPGSAVHAAGTGGPLISRVSLPYLSVLLTLDVLSWSAVTAIINLIVTHIMHGRTYVLPGLLCTAAAFVTNRLLRRGLTQQVFATPDGLHIRQWNHSVTLPWNAIEGQWNLRAGSVPFYGVIQRRGTAPLLLRRYRLSVCLKDHATRLPHTLNAPGRIIDVKER